MKVEQQQLEREVTAFLESATKDEIQTRGNALTYYGKALDFAMPRFIEVIEKTDGVWTDAERYLIASSSTILGSIGREARCAIPNLVELLRPDDCIVWRAAFNAIVRITEMYRGEPKVVDEILEELEAILQKMNSKIMQREILIENLRNLLPGEELSKITPTELEEKLQSEDWHAVYWASVDFLQDQPKASEHCRGLVKSFLDVSEIMLWQERLRDTVSTIEEKRRQEWQNLSEIGKAVQDWISQRPTLISRVYMFGSRVRKSFTPESDLDIAIELQLPAGGDDTAFWRQNADSWQAELEQRLPYDVDLHWLKDAKQTPDLYRDIQAGYVLLCERGDFTWEQWPDEPDMEGEAL